MTMGALLVERALTAAAVVLLLAGAASAWTSANALKRLGGLVVAALGAIVALAALGAPQALLIAAAAALFAQIAVGAALLVRLQEDYGGVEIPEIDFADAQSEPPEPAP